MVFSGLIPAAMAQGVPAGSGAGGFDLMGLVPFALILVVMYFLVIRPQQKKAKDHAEMVSALRRGDRILTAGGIFGTVYKVGGDDELQVEIAEGIRVRVLKSTVSQVLAKTEPVAVVSQHENTEGEEKITAKKMTSVKKSSGTNARSRKAKEDSKENK